MGQVKSRVQCCEENCGRVSTTFDPFMYLSVPIPGSSERNMVVTYVPRDPAQPAQKIQVKVNKTANVEELLKNLRDELPKLGLVDPAVPPIPLENLCLTDVWQSAFYSWIEPESEVENIRDNDKPFVYELRPLAEVQQIEKNIDAAANSTTGDVNTAESLGIRDIQRSHRYHLDVATLTRVNAGDAWTKELLGYLNSPHYFLNAFHPSKGNSEGRVRMYRRLVNFVEQCHKATEGDDTAGQKRTREENGDASHSPGVMNGGHHHHHKIHATAGDEPVKEIMQTCETSSHFRNVETKHDVAVLELLAGKVFAEIHANGTTTEGCLSEWYNC